MKRIAWLISLWFTVVVEAQVLPSHNKLKELGLIFDIPHGWVGQLSGEIIMFAHSSISGLMVLSKNNAKSTNELKQLAMLGVNDGGIQLNPSDDFKIVNKNRVEGFYQGYYDGVPVKVFAIGLINPFGNGVNIIIMTETDKFSQQHQTQALKLAQSVKFINLSNISYKNRLIITNDFYSY